MPVVTTKPRTTRVIDQIVSFIKDPKTPSHPHHLVRKAWWKDEANHVAFLIDDSGFDLEFDTSTRQYAQTVWRGKIITAGVPAGSFTVSIWPDDEGSYQIYIYKITRTC